MCISILLLVLMVSEIASNDLLDIYFLQEYEYWLERIYWKIFVVYVFMKCFPHLYWNISASIDLIAFVFALYFWLTQPLYSFDVRSPPNLLLLLLLVISILLLISFLIWSLHQTVLPQDSFIVTYILGTYSIRTFTIFFVSVSAK